MVRKSALVAFAAIVLVACGGSEGDSRDRNVQTPSGGAVKQGVECKKAGKMVVSGKAKFGCAKTSEGKRWVMVGDRYKSTQMCDAGIVTSVVTSDKKSITGCFWDKTTKADYPELRQFFIVSLVESLAGSAPPVVSVAVAAPTTIATPTTVAATGTTGPAAASATTANATGGQQTPASTQATTEQQSPAAPQATNPPIVELTASDAPGLEVVRSYADGVIVRFTVPANPTAPIDGYGIEISPACRGCSVESVDGNVMKVVGLPSGTSHTIAAYSTSGPRQRSPLSTPVRAATYNIGDRGPGGGIVYRAARIPSATEVKSKDVGSSDLMYDAEYRRWSRFWMVAVKGESDGQPPAGSLRLIKDGRWSTVDLTPQKADEFAVEDSVTGETSFVTTWLVSGQPGTRIASIRLPAPATYVVFSCVDEMCSGVREAMGGELATSFSEVATEFAPGGPVEWSKAKSTAAAYKGGGQSGWRLVDSDMRDDSSEISKQLKWRGNDCPAFMDGARAWSEVDAGDSAFAFKCGEMGLGGVLAKKTDRLAILAVRDF